MKLRKIHLIKGYTMVELLITLTIFGIVALFAVPAFSTFIERSRATTQISQAANFLRSAQEIAIANNRTVYVYTEGLFTYKGDLPKERADYWYKDWVMAFKPMGVTYLTMGKQVDELIANTDDYLIAKQRIFSKSQKYILSIIDSENHNNILLQSAHNPDGSAYGDMEGYGKVRKFGGATYQGFVEGAPTFIAFYPTGEASLPIFVVSERIKSKDEKVLADTAPFAYDYSFKLKPGASMANQWTNDVQKEFINPIAMLAGCRTGRSLTVDAINYTFDQSIMRGDYIFEGDATSISKAFSISVGIVGVQNYAPPPSFGHYLCGSKFLR